MALERRPELREEDYKTRIDVLETKRQIASLFPNLNLFGGISYEPARGEAWFGYATVRTEEDYLARLSGLFDALHESPVVCGYCYTQLTDTLQETNGLLDEHRVTKA